MRQKKILKILAVCFSTVMLTQPASAAAPQQTAQGAAGADGIPIGAAMGQDEEVISLPEKIGGFIQRQRRHGVPPEARAADGAAG